jgi:hypothetical protein
LLFLIAFSRDGQWNGLTSRQSQQLRRGSPETLGMQMNRVRLLIPPCVTPAVMVVLAAAVLLGEARAPTVFPSGAPDDAPRNAAGLILIASPCLYAGLLAVHWGCMRYPLRVGGVVGSHLLAACILTFVFGARALLAGEWRSLFAGATIVSLAVLSLSAGWLIVGLIEK